VKSAEEIMNILEAYDLTGSLRDAGFQCQQEYVAEQRLLADRNGGRFVGIASF